MWVGTACDGDPMNEQILDDESDLQDKIARCHRLAAMMTDGELRHSFEALAREYESRLPRRGGGFMLQPRERPPQRSAE
jgi:hypothetical protein